MNKKTETKVEDRGEVGRGVSNFGQLTRVNGRWMDIRRVSMVRRAYILCATELSRTFDGASLVKLALVHGSATSTLFPLPRTTGCRSFSLSISLLVQ